MDRQQFLRNEQNIGDANIAATKKPGFTGHKPGTVTANPHLPGTWAAKRFDAFQERRVREGFVRPGIPASTPEAPSLLGNPDFRSNFERAMAEAIVRKNVGGEDPSQRINMAADRIAQSEGGAALDLQKRAAAGGYGTGGGIQAGLQGLYENFSAQKADSAREITRDVEESNAAANRAEENRLLQALGLAGGQMTADRSYGLAKLTADRSYGLSQQELELRQRAQAFQERQAAAEAKYRQDAEKNRMMRAMSSMHEGAGGGGGVDRSRLGPQVIGGGIGKGAADALNAERATRRYTGAGMARDTAAAMVKAGGRGY